MTMLIEQETAKPPRRAPARPEIASKRAPIWVRADVFTAEVSTARKIAAWVALAICLAILVWLLIGY